MDNFYIYLAGAMSAFGADNFNEGNKWRTYIQKRLPQLAEKYGAIKKPVVINPNDHFNFLDDTTYISQREIKEFDIHKAASSDLVIVNFNTNNSIGTSKEIAICHYLRIHVIGLNENKLELHPWDTDDCNRILYNIDEMAEYVVKHYLMD